MNKKIMYVVIAIVVICAGVIIGKDIIKNENTVETSKNYNNETNKNVIVNNTKNEVSNEISNETKNEIENTEIENNVKEDETNINTEEKEGGNEEENKEKAIEIAKKDWGEDDSVSFKFDRIDSNGNYIIVVREKATTNALRWYTVDVEDEKVID